jgi:hypothetical protein
MPTTFICQKQIKDNWTAIFGKHGERQNILTAQRLAVGNFTA